MSKNKKKFFVYDSLSSSFLFPLSQAKIKNRMIYVGRVYFKTLFAAKSKIRAEMKARNISKDFVYAFKIWEDLDEKKVKQSFTF